MLIGKAVTAKLLIFYHMLVCTDWKSIHTAQFFVSLPTLNNNNSHDYFPNKPKLRNLNISYLLRIGFCTAHLQTSHILTTNVFEY